MIPGFTAEQSLLTSAWPYRAGGTTSRFLSRLYPMQTGETGNYDTSGEEDGGGDGGSGDSGGPDPTDEGDNSPDQPPPDDNPPAYEPLSSNYEVAWSCQATTGLCGCYTSVAGDCDKLKASGNCAGPLKNCPTNAKMQCCDYNGPAGA